MPQDTESSLDNKISLMERPPRPRRRGRFFHMTRGLLLDVIGVWILMSFVRMFVVENYRIPTGSMTPTLIGGEVARLDLDGDKDEDLVVIGKAQYTLLIRQEDGFEHRRTPSLPPGVARRVREVATTRYDHILVSKFHYWFHSPERGDIAVFKAPPKIYDPAAPVYVKRIAGLPGERVSIYRGRLIVDGEPVRQPDLFETQYYDARLGNGGLFKPTRLASYEVLMLGDNTLNSFDSRAWGPLPLKNLKGRVIYRYYPFSAAGVPR